MVTATRPHSLPSNQAYRVWIIYKDVSGQAQEKSFRTSSTELAILKDDFFIDGRSVSHDGVYQWAVEVVEAADGVFQPVSPRTHPLFQFRWNAPVATVQATPVSTMVATTPSEDPTPVCRSGQVWNEIMNRCQPDPNNQKSPSEPQPSTPIGSD